MDVSLHEGQSVIFPLVEMEIEMEMEIILFTEVESKNGI